MKPSFMRRNPEELAAEFPYAVGDVRHSELKVLRTNEGYFLGRTCWIDKGGSAYEGMGSRESGYYPTKEAAQAALDSGDFDVRECPENELAYSQGLPRPK